MQDLIVGERYYVKHGTGNWEGEVTFEGTQENVMNGVLLIVSDIKVTGGTDKLSAIKHFHSQGNRAKLGSTPEWWGFEPVNFSLENE